jgi:hypothetical protein
MRTRRLAAKGKADAREARSARSPGKPTLLLEMLVSDSDSTNQVDETEVAMVVREIANGRVATSVAGASALLDCGLSRIYQMVNSGELPSFLLGGSRKIAIVDIARLVVKKRREPLQMRICPWDLNGPGERKYWPHTAEPGRRGRGRPRKSLTAAVASEDA